jgi:tetratricopeptide (TPR) repeat protein
MDLDDYEASTGRKPPAGDVGATTGELPSDVWASRLLNGLDGPAAAAAAASGDGASVPAEDDEAAWTAALAAARRGTDGASEPAEDDEAAWMAALAAARARAEHEPEASAQAAIEIPMTVAAPVAASELAAAALESAHIAASSAARALELADIASAAAATALMQETPSVESVESADIAANVAASTPQAPAVESADIAATSAAPAWQAPAVESADLAAPTPATQAPAVESADPAAPMPATQAPAVELADIAAAAADTTAPVPQAPEFESADIAAPAEAETTLVAPVGPPVEATADASVEPAAEARVGELATQARGSHPTADAQAWEPAADAWAPEPATDAQAWGPGADAYAPAPAADGRTSATTADAHDREPAADAHDREPPADAHDREPPADADAREPALAAHAQETTATGSRHSDAPAEPPLAPATAAAATPSAAAQELALVAERLRAGRLVLCAGPRLAPGQLGLRDAVARLLALLPADEAAEARVLLDARPLAAAGWLRRRLGDGFAGALVALTAGVDAAGERLQHAAALPFRAVVTTAWDDALDRALAAAGTPRPSYTARDTAALAGESGPFVLHLFGDARRPETLVATNEDLGVLVADAELRAVMHELYRFRSFLFVGFDARDPELELLLERLLLGARRDGEHFAVLPSAGAIDRDELRAAWGVRVLAEADAGAALAELTAALAAQPAPAEPAHDDADGWLQILAAHPGDAAASFALDRLTVELRERGDHQALVELLLGRVAVEPQPSRRAEMLLAVARLFEHEADDAPRALTALLAAYKEEPAQAAWYELERLAHTTNGWDDVLRELGPAVHALPATVRAPLWRRLERWSELTRALDDLAAAAGPDARAHALEAATLVHERLRDPAAAIHRLEALAADAPRDLPLLGTLEQLYEETGQTIEWLGTLARQADAHTDGSARAALCRKLALAWEVESDGGTQAGHWWYMLLAVEPDALDAVRALERMHREQREWAALADVQMRHAELLSGRAAADAWVELSGLREHELSDVDGAIAALQAALRADPEHAQALAGLTRLYDATGAWHLTVELLDRQARKSNDPVAQAELLHRAGELAAARLNDARQAEAFFARVLELEPAHVPSLTALAALHEKNGAKLRAAKLLVEAVEHTANRLERTRILVAAARLYEELENLATATELYLSALAIDPEHDEASARLSELLWKAERWEELVPVLEMLTRKPSEPSLQVERLLRLARAARNVGQDDKVPRAYARAAELDVTNREAQRGHANHLMAAGQWEPALRALERLFQHHVDRMTVAERAALFADLAHCELSLGQRQSAREFVASALDVDPTHRPSLLLQAELAGDDPAALVEAKRALLVSADADEQVRLLGEIGDLYHDRLRELDRAVGAWAEALELRPRDHKLLHKCLDAYVADKAWPQALEMLERLIAAEDVDAVRAKYRHAAALICRDELARSDDAVAHLKAALDDDPQLERSAVALEPLLVQRQDWVELARLYRRKLKWLGPESPDDADRHNGERLRVWTALGELCLEKLNEPETARAALEVALAFDRNNHERHKRFADVCVQAHAWEQAIVEHQLVLAREKNRILSFRALKHLYIQTHDREKSIACSYALAFLRKGEPDDVARVADHKKLPFATTRRVLGDDGWARLTHPDEDRLLDHLFALVGPTMVAAQAQPHKAFGLARKDAVGAVDRSYAKTLAYVTTILDVVPPELHVKPEQREPVVFANCIDGRELVPVFILGGPLVSERRREAELVFELARRAAQLRPERLMRLALPHPQPIMLVIEAAMALADGSGTGADVVRTAAALERALPGPQLEQVQAIGAKLRASRVVTDEAAMAWLRATDLTGSRVGLTLAGDLETCARLLASEGQPAGTAAPTERLLDLVWSSVTEEMFMVRRLLGLPL